MKLRSEDKREVAVLIDAYGMLWDGRKVLLHMARRLGLAQGCGSNACSRRGLILAGRDETAHAPGSIGSR